MDIIDIGYDVFNKLQDECGFNKYYMTASSICLFKHKKGNTPPSYSIRVYNEYEIRVNDRKKFYIGIGMRGSDIEDCCSDNIDEIYSLYNEMIRSDKINTVLNV